MNDEQKKLLKEAVEWVEWQNTLPEPDRQWHQSRWIAVRDEDGGFTNIDIANHYRDAPTCGTAFCLAGYIGQRLEPAFMKSETIEIDGYPTHVSTFAARALGYGQEGYSSEPVTPAQKEDPAAWEYPGDNEPFSYDLFDGDNTAEDIRAIAEYMAGEPL